MKRFCHVNLLCGKCEDSIPGSRTCHCRDLDYSRKIHHHRSPAIPFLSRPRYSFPFFISPQRASLSLSWPTFPLRYLGKLKITTLFLSIFFATNNKTFLPLHHRLFIIARWYPAHETALCCSILLPARSCYWNPPPDRSARHRRRHPPPADPPRPYVCLDASHRPCCRPSISSSRGFYSGERIAVVICIWKSTRTLWEHFGAWMCSYRSRGGVRCLIYIKKVCFNVLSLSISLWHSSSGKRCRNYIYISYFNNYTFNSG